MPNAPTDVSEVYTINLTLEELFVMLRSFHERQHALEALLKVAKKRARILPRLAADLESDATRELETLNWLIELVSLHIGAATRKHGEHVNAV